LCAVDVLEEDGRTHRLAVEQPEDPEKVVGAHELQRRYPPDPGATRGLPEVLRSERSEFYLEISAEMPVAAARDPEHHRLMREIGSQQSMRHRARELGGELALESAPGSGTRVRFKIPVSRLVGEGDPAAQGELGPPRSGDEGALTA